MWTESKMRQHLTVDPFIQLTGSQGHKTGRIHYEFDNSPLEPSILQGFALTDTLLLLRDSRDLKCPERTNPHWLCESGRPLGQIL